MLIEALPKTEILEFVSPREFGLDRLAEYYQSCCFAVCEYSLGIKLMCEELYHYAFAEAGGCLICRDEYEGVVYFDYPIAKDEKSDVGVAMEAIETYCMEKDIQLRYTTLPPEVLGEICARYDGVRMRNTYYCADYLYNASDIRDFQGKKYAGQRNHVRRFWRNCPTAKFRPMTSADLPLLESFFTRFDAGFQKRGADAAQEKNAARALLRMGNGSIFRVGCMELEGEIIGVALGEKCGDTLVEHVEKALSAEYEGIYPALAQEFVKLFGEDCLYLNREDDASERGLRISKLQYQPLRIAKKYDVDIENILYTISEIPTLKSERLTLDAIRDSDAEPYGALCLDDERNRFWGYDYREDLTNPEGADFCRMASVDFEERRTLSFAVRLHGDLIGEVVLYRFDNRGSAEIGIRILPAYSGYGYGREAAQAAMDWALYGLGMTRVCAKCFRENLPSVKMLSALMKQVREDDRMLYFERIV